MYTISVLLLTLISTWCWGADKPLTITVSSSDVTIYSENILRVATTSGEVIYVNDDMQCFRCIPFRFVKRQNPLSLTIALIKSCDATGSAFYYCILNSMTLSDYRGVGVRGVLSTHEDGSFYITTKKGPEVYPTTTVYEGKLSATGNDHCTRQTLIAANNQQVQALLKCTPSEGKNKHKIDHIVAFISSGTEPADCADGRIIETRNKNAIEIIDSLIRINTDPAGAGAGSGGGGGSASAAGAGSGGAGASSVSSVCTGAEYTIISGTLEKLMAHPLGGPKRFFIKFTDPAEDKSKKIDLIFTNEDDQESVELLW